MAIEGTDGIARGLRALAQEVAEQQARELNALSRDRLRFLGELIILAADSAAEMAGDSAARDRLIDEVADEMFDELIYRQWPDGSDGA